MRLTTARSRNPSAAPHGGKSRRRTASGGSLAAQTSPGIGGAWPFARRFRRLASGWLLAAAATGALWAADVVGSGWGAVQRQQALRDWAQRAATEAAAGARFADLSRAGALAELAQARRQRALAAATAALTALFLATRRPGSQPACLPRAVRRRLAAIAAAPPALAPPGGQDGAEVARADLPAEALPQVDALVASVGGRPRDAIQLLQEVQRAWGFVPSAALERIVATTPIAAADLAGVASFYARFRTAPRGRRRIRVCRGAACHGAGADRLVDAVRRRFGIPPGRDTDPACQATLEEVACLGCCTLAPVLQVDGILHGHVAIDRWEALLDARRAATEPAARRGGRDASSDAMPIELRVGVGSCCIAGGSARVLAALEDEVRRTGYPARIRPVGCVGMCHVTPLVEAVGPEGVARLAVKATVADVPGIVAALPPHADCGWRWRARRWKTRWLRRSAPAATAVEPFLAADAAGVGDFLEPQVRIVTEHSGRLDPTSLDDYLRHDGMRALASCLQASNPAQTIEAIERSGLRGRGGGSFPTGRKWRAARQAAGSRKYVVMNGDEGDPGAFMDRMVMESFPFRVLEGLAIAAYAIGAGEAVLYIRQEYPLALQRMRGAIAQLEQAGWLGDRIAGTPFSLRVETVEGAGAFVCGEETALLASIMGKRGTPRPRPPFPVEQGLWGFPTLVNNVETLANVPWIFRRGPEAFAAVGSAGSKGTKVFSLSGKVRRGGLIEVPMGSTLNDIVLRIGGGPLPGRAFKAVQIGGPSGACLPSRLGDTPVDYDALQEVGAMMGSGGLVAMDDADCMVDAARYFLHFTHRESCGRCTFCRVGVQRMLEILDRICVGRGRAGDLEDLEQICRATVAGSLCGLGRTSANPVLSTLRYFREEYEAHLQGRCPARKCRDLVAYRVTDACSGCTLCAQQCPVGAIAPTPYRRHAVDPQRCTRCDACRVVCPEQAIEAESPGAGPAAERLVARGSRHGRAGEGSEAECGLAGGRHGAAVD